jgi:hypothetical protein
MSSRKAEEKDCQHNQGDYHVQSVMFDGERGDREGHAGNGRGDQDEHPELNDTAALERQDAGQDSSERSQVGGLASEDRIIRTRHAVAHQQDALANEYDRDGKQDPGAKKITNRLLYVPVGEPVSIPAHLNPPVKP